jgi:hypothetical protein
MATNPEIDEALHPAASDARPSDDGKADDTPMTPVQHAQFARVHAEAAHAHITDALGHLAAAHPEPDADDVPDADDNSGSGDSGDGHEATPARAYSAQSRSRSFPAGSVNARTASAMRGPRS